jgi:FkbM family methyltransferase
MNPIRVAFIKFSGLSAGGTERWLQTMAASLPRDLVSVDYYYCDSAPYIGSKYRHADTDPHRLEYMRSRGVNLVKFHVGAKDIRTPTHDWRNTDFWQVFAHGRYDLVQVAKAGPAEYPFHRLSLPVVEMVALNAGVDHSPTIAWSIHLSQWQRGIWIREGGSLERSSVIPVPALPPASQSDLRRELNIPVGAIVAGFHQRADDAIHSPVPLAAFAELEHEDRYFVVMGGGKSYRDQARRLGLRNVRFLDHSGDEMRLSEFLNTLDIFAHGRRDGETFGTVLAEAMMHGKPCLSHKALIGNNNAQPETTGPGGLFAEDDVEYHDFLETLFIDPALRQKLGVKGREHADRYYSVFSGVESLVEIYHSVMRRTTPARHNRPISYARSPLGFLHAGSLDSRASIAYCALTNTIPEAAEVEIAQFFLPRARGMLDIGANIGLYCLVAAQECPAGARIHAFEPQADCCDALSATVRLNNWQDRLFIHRLAISDKPGEAPLHLTGTGSTIDNAFNDHASLPTVQVSLDTVDNQVRTLGLEQIDFIKIDVEGHELSVLKGAAKTIQHHTPVLFIEIADAIRGRAYRNPHYRETIRWLHEHGYSAYRCSEWARLVPAKPDKGNGHVAMYLCLHRNAHQDSLRPLRVHLATHRRRNRRRVAGIIVQRIERQLFLVLRACKRFLMHIRIVCTG